MLKVLIYTVHDIVSSYVVSSHIQNWTKALCKMDSDGDGKSNGEELGDPYCLFSMKYKSAHVVDPIGHPGKSLGIWGQAGALGNSWGLWEDMWDLWCAWQKVKPQKTPAFSRQCITRIANLIYTCFT